MMNQAVAETAKMSAKPVRDYLAMLLRSEMNLSDVVWATGIQVSRLRQFVNVNARQSKHQQVSPAMALRIVAVAPRMVAPVRLLQDLLLRSWSLAAIGREIGVHETTLGRMCSGRSPKTNPRVARAVQEFYDAHRGRTGTSPITRLYAIRAGYLPLENTGVYVRGPKNSDLAGEYNQDEFEYKLEAVVQAWLAACIQRDPVWGTIDAANQAFLRLRFLPADLSLPTLAEFTSHTGLNRKAVREHVYHVLDALLANSEPSPTYESAVRTYLVLLLAHS